MGGLWKWWGDTGVERDARVYNAVHQARAVAEPRTRKHAAIKPGVKEEVQVLPGC